MCSVQIVQKIAQADAPLNLPGQFSSVQKSKSRNLCSYPGRISEYEPCYGWNDGVRAR
jgi:hypothetical protein